VDKVVRMDVFNSRDELVCEEQNGLEAEFAVAKVEEIPNGRAKKVEDHDVVVALGTEPSHKRDPNATRESLVDLGLVLELRVLGLDRLELDGNLFTGNDVYSEINVTKGAGANLFLSLYFPPTRRLSLSEDVSAIWNACG
jgi:hypothetical protein